MANGNQTPQPLKRDLTLFSTTAIVIGSVVGSGIFVSSAGMARDLGSARILLLVWLIGGILTLFGAMTQCELAGQMPRTGGLYEFLKIIYGKKVGFFYGWANFTIAGSGSIAAISFIFASYVGEYFELPHLAPALEAWAIHLPYIGNLYPLDNLGVKLVGSSLIIGLTIFNVLGVKRGANLQGISTTCKILAILGIVGSAFFLGGDVGSVANFSSTNPLGDSLSHWQMVGAMGLALGGAFWSYDGWGNVAYIAGEVHQPEKTIPRAIILGTLSFIALYLLVNLAYLYILPVDSLGKVPEDRVASRVVAEVLGKPGALFVALLIILSTFDTVNASILTNARVYYAMAKDNVFWRRAGETSKAYRTPAIALLCQGGWSLILLFSGSFSIIASMYVFVNWLFYVLMAVGVFVLRWRNPKTDRPYSIPGYPWVPATFAIFSTCYVGLTLFMDIKAFQQGTQPLINSLMGLVLVFIGLPFYLYWRWRYAAIPLRNKP